MEDRYIVAIDLGASSGRVMLSCYQQQIQKITLKEIHRFNNGFKAIDNDYCWDLVYLEQQILIGLNKIIQQNIKIDSIGIDSWGVDYVLLDKNGQVVGSTYSYRDHRTDNVMSLVQSELSTERIYQKTGIQFLTFNTLYQLKAMMINPPTWLSQVTDLVMIPDYFIYRLTGQLNREYTNATTTQLVNVVTKNWDDDLLNYLGIPRKWFGTISQPGNQVGMWKTPEGDRIPVIAIASHDTASAVIAAPINDQHSAYLCSGTWSLMGIESKQPVTGQPALNANITNEGGVDGHFRVLKNIMGLWLFQRVCVEHEVKDITSLIQLAEQESAFTYLINPNDCRLLNPQSMTETIKQICLENHGHAPERLSQLLRCIFDSLAHLYRDIIKELVTITNRKIETLHIVGGGCQNAFLNQLCADVCQINVTAGPIESSSLGNVGYQLIALGDIKNVNTLRHIIAQNFDTKYYSPTNNYLKNLYIS
ncbi:rhamnulokinase [Gilliamella sp. B2776]|uniref:rhamnulokinase n=1 Tax=unclassified Gilliamella TaxID=2685620 RepID=UPI002269B788|nr:MULTISPECIES: rhamnulokinase [unclassified Gilliamella]MCX8649134.1 rhamnulokinase [Gilliamella sp. B2779]MCX8652990.1 rhamnulokinase [Gilliamella sp. B2737]MCX8655250.1 rhamnulokinase [Gilliamella sp. B2894]MCX8664733.1 rhamnulokinase [Gilliamella sp. B2887]MCX8690946.1 rhamnulokinase [Gilliamella sp. B2776]